MRGKKNNPQKVKEYSFVQFGYKFICFTRFSGKIYLGKTQ